MLPYLQAFFSSRPVTIAPHILSSMHFLPGLQHSSIPGQIVWSRGSCKLVVILLHLIFHIHSDLQCGRWWNTHNVVPSLCYERPSHWLSLKMPNIGPWYWSGSWKTIHLLCDFPSILTKAEESVYTKWLKDSFVASSITAKKSIFCHPLGINSSLAV